jgi:hypothetical protein
MKKLFFLFGLLFFANSIFSQNTEVYSKIKTYIENMGYTISNKNSFYANLKQGEKFFSYKTFYPNNEYIIVAFSEDYYVNDIDVYLCETNGDIYKKDTDVDDVAVLKFSPAYEYSMKLYVENYDSDDPNYSSKCWVLIGYK